MDNSLHEDVEKLSNSCIQGEKQCAARGGTSDGVDGGAVKHDYQLGLDIKMSVIGIDLGRSGHSFFVAYH